MCASTTSLRGSFAPTNPNVWTTLARLKAYTHYNKELLIRKRATRLYFSPVHQYVQDTSALMLKTTHSLFNSHSLQN